MVILELVQKSQEENSSQEYQKKVVKRSPKKKIFVLKSDQRADLIEQRPIFYNSIDNELKENDLLPDSRLTDAAEIL
jgi:hypothetical protein